MNTTATPAQVTVEPIEITTRIRVFHADPITRRFDGSTWTPMYGHFVGMIDKGVLWFDVTATIYETLNDRSVNTHVYRSMSAKTAADLPAWVIAGAREVAQSLGVRLPFDGDDQ